MRNSKLIDRFYIYDKDETGTIRRTISIIWQLRKERFDSVFITCHSLDNHLPNLALVLFSFLISTKRRLFIDAQLNTQRVTINNMSIAVLDFLRSWILICLARLLTRVLLVFAPDSSSSDNNLFTFNRERKGRIAVLVPVIPDLSHTFVYREIICMKKYSAELEVIGLRKGSFSLIHPEAQELLPVTTFIPDLPLAQYAALYLKYVWLMPRRLSKMLNYFRRYCSEKQVLKIDHYFNSLHPLRCLLLVELLRNLNISKIHAYGASYPATIALGASIMLDLPYSFSTFVDFEHDYEYKMLREKVHAAQFVIACTKFCQARLVQLTDVRYKDKIYVIHHSLDPEYGNHVYPQSNTAPNEPIKIITVGRLVEKKGLEYLVYACGLLKERGLRYQCLIIGDGPEKHRIASLIKKHNLQNEIMMKGPIENDKIKNYYGVNTIMVMPCVYASDGERDGIPNSLLEAMICGSPVVSTRISGIPELIEDGHNGFLVPDKDHLALADAIERLMKYDELRREFAQRGQETIRQRFNLNDKAKHLLSLLQY